MIESLVLTNQNTLAIDKIAEILPNVKKDQGNGSEEAFMLTILYGIAMFQQSEFQTTILVLYFFGSSALKYPQTINMLYRLHDLALSKQNSCIQKMIEVLIESKSNLTKPSTSLQISNIYSLQTNSVEITQIWRKLLM